VHVIGNASGKPYTMTRISYGRPGEDQITPVTSGDLIVWAGYNNSSYDLALYNATSGEERVITWTTTTDELEPAISGSHLVYTDMTTYPASIRYIDLAGSSDLAITPLDSPYNPSSPAISGDTVTYTGEDLIAGTRDVYVANISDMSVFILTPGTETSNEWGAVIDGTMIVYITDAGGQGYDIMAYDTSNGRHTRITEGTDGSNQADPAVSGDLIAWTDDRFGTRSVNIYNLSENRTLLLSPGAGVEQTRPSLRDGILVFLENSGIATTVKAGTWPFSSLVTLSPLEDSGVISAPAAGNNRIVWEERAGGISSITLVTLGTTETCPMADFIADRMTGEAPLKVNFSTRSTYNDVLVTWDFGDGSRSHELSPSHTYTVPGRYNVALTVNTASCRDRREQEGLITVNMAPLVSFVQNVTAGCAPMTVEFNDTSKGTPTRWNWSFGDGGRSDIQNPFHTYLTPGTYTVTLTAGNAYGEGNWTVNGGISVRNGTHIMRIEEMTGVIQTEENGTPFLTVNSTFSGNVTFDPDITPTHIRLIPRPSQGIASIDLYAHGAGFSKDEGGNLSGLLSGVVINSDAITPNDLPPLLGPGCTFQYSLELPTLPYGGEVLTTAYGEIRGEEYRLLLPAVYTADFSGISATGWALQFDTDNVPNCNSTLSMSINSRWVVNNCQVDRATGSSRVVYGSFAHSDRAPAW
jgi:beta propeller repeat protein